jgi:hypothetical protein
MADNLTTQSATPATIPASSVIATDDAGAGGHVQIVKLAVSTDGSATPLTANNTDGLLVNLGSNNDVTVTGSVTASAGTNLNTSALALETGGNLAAAVTALQIIDNFISGSKGLVTEDNSASILSSLQTIDNFISGARGLVTEDNSAAIKTAVEIIDNFISGSRGLVTEDNSAAALTSLQLLDDTVATIASAITAKGIAIAGTDGTNARILKTDTSGELQVDVLTMPNVTIGAAIPAGANNIGDVDVLTLPALPAGTNNIGDVDVLTLPALPTGTNTIGSVKLTDGTDTADVLDLTNSNPLTVAIVDGAGSQITSFGGGTQYTEADTDASITGTAVMWEDTSDTLRAVSSSNPLPVFGVGGGAGDGAILDGVSSSIKATVLDYTNTNPLAVRLSDTNGDYVGAGAGTQYTEDAAAAADPVGTVLNLIRKDTPASEVTTDGDNIAARGNSAGAQYVELLSGTAKIGGDATNGLKVDITRIAAGTNNIGDVDILTIAAGDNNIGNVDIVTVPAPLSTTGGGTEAAALRVTLANDSTGLVSVDDNGASLTVDNGGTFAVQVDGAALTSLQLADDVIATLGTTTYTEAATKGTLIGAVRRDADTTLVDTTNEVAPLQVNAAGQLKVSNITALPAGTNNIGDVDILSIAAGDNNIGNVDIVTLPNVTNGGTFAVQESGSALTALQLIDDIVYTDDTSTHSTGTSKGALIMAAAAPTDTAVNANDIGAVGMTANRSLYVSVQDALPAGTNGIGKLTANSGVTIGAVEVAAAQTLANVTTVATVTTLTGGGVAHGAADSGNPVKVGAKASATLSDDTMAANANRIDLTGDLDGALYVRQVPLGDLIYEAISNTDGASTASSNFGATASTRNYITSITAFRTDAATTLAYIDFRDGTAGSVIYRVPLPPSGGVTINNGGIPLFYTTANTALAYDVSAALTTVYISLTGFKSKARA